MGRRGLRVGRSFKHRQNLRTLSPPNRRHIRFQNVPRCPFATRMFIKFHSRASQLAQHQSRIILSNGNAHAISIGGSLTKPSFF